MQRINNKLIADEGMALTNGEALGKTVHLASGDDGTGWREVTKEEAAVLRKDLEEAQAEDYEAALTDLGVEFHAD